VVRNYQNAIKQVGGVVLWETNRETTLKLAKKDLEFWSLVSEYGTAVTITVVERQAMKQDIVANAEAWANDLKANGHAAVYGIYFDTGSATVKPESEPALQEIAKLVGADAALKIWVVGHTDSVGGLESNLKLSQARAEAVRAALTTRHGIAAGRLSAQGVGPLSPVASNATDEGKAKNRRVELVAQ
jgi:outer membrane protein OmpA-like peptidoglycan-associated protein